MALKPEVAGEIRRNQRRSCGPRSDSRVVISTEMRPPNPLPLKPRRVLQTRPTRPRSLVVLRQLVPMTCRQCRALRRRQQWEPQRAWDLSGASSSATEPLNIPTAESSLAMAIPGQPKPAPTARHATAATAASSVVAVTATTAATVGLPAGLATEAPVVLESAVPAAAPAGTAARADCSSATVATAAPAD